MIGNALALSVFIAVTAWLAAGFYHGGLEVLAAIGAGAAMSAYSSRNSLRVDRIADGAFAGMFVGLMLSGMLHTPLSALVAAIIP